MDLLGLLLPLMLIGLLIYMLVSQRRRQREVERMQSSLTVGDEVLTVGGIIGRLAAVDGPILDLEISSGVVIRIDRRTVSGRLADVPGLGHRHDSAGRPVDPHRPADDDGREPGSPTDRP
ncbi:MAG: preprotein translocase subunit YajC [Mobilicoccus sp.]|nr:preprotein translocase subunit YajC [Mobilicoccus sp.]